MILLDLEKLSMFQTLTKDSDVHCDLFLIRIDIFEKYVPQNTQRFVNTCIFRISLRCLEG